MHRPLMNDQRVCLYLNDEISLHVSGDNDGQLYILCCAGIELYGFRRWGAVNGEYVERGHEGDSLQWDVVLWYL